uniref:Uncharacterized protein n=1 Tax=Candidatus Kentrum sp. DK TaxID=2126562 RepID=A0A450S8S0_9GAMM|nr:MAG: hypothetical protein BECKDK2373C_GA0170839_102137 [Candidatus Kentron sp. DK]
MFYSEMTSIASGKPETAIRLTFTGDVSPSGGAAHKKRLFCTPSISGAARSSAMENPRPDTQAATAYPNAVSRSSSGVWFTRTSNLSCNTANRLGVRYAGRLGPR